MLGSRVLLDGWPHGALTGVSAPRQLIVYHIAHLFCRFSAQQCSAHTPNSFLGRRLCQGVTRLRSISAWFTTVRDRGCRPHEAGLAPHLLSEGSMVLDLAAWLFKHCISILWLLTETLSGPTFVPPAVSECVHVMPPAKSLIISVDMTRKGAMVDSVIAVCCMTYRLDFFNGLGKSLLLMYNLLLILNAVRGAC